MLIRLEARGSGGGGVRLHITWTHHMWVQLPFFSIRHKAATISLPHFVVDYGSYIPPCQ